MEWTGSLQDSADVCLYSDSSDCTVRDNLLIGGGWHGVLVQSPSASTTCRRHSIINNRIGAHSAYGIAAYNIAPDNAGHLIGGNYIQDIGGINPNGCGGAGIYLKAIGGNVVSDNHIKNCCTSTISLSTLAPAGIGQNGVNTSDGLITNIITGNVISGMAQGNGIFIVSSTSGAVIYGNAVSLTNDGGIPIFIKSSSNVMMSGNSVRHLTSFASDGVLIYADGIDIFNIQASGNSIRNTGYAGMRVVSSGSWHISGISLFGNTISDQGAASIPVRLDHCIGATVTANTVSSQGAYVMSVNETTAARVTANVMTSTGASPVLVTNSTGVVIQ